MRKHILLVITLIITGFAQAQNLQVHYDFGSGLYDKDLATRPLVTTTLEMFRPDKWGSTFFFVDMDHTSKGVASSYWEIARELKFWKGPLSVHVEYNGGNSNAFSYKNMYLAGGTYTYNNADFSKGFSLSAMYKYIQKADQPNNFQITGTWYAHFAKNKLCTFIGFADFWREKNPNGNYIFLTEPQFWVNLNKIKGVNEKFKLSVGSELELSNNFAGRKGFYAIPTAALKWNFE